jgi:hypothetical protein
MHFEADKTLSAYADDAVRRGASSPEDAFGRLLRRGDRFYRGDLRLNRRYEQPNIISLGHLRRPTR